MAEPIEALMAKVRCPGWPKCVEEIYDKVMARYDEQGCFLTDPAYYEGLALQYGILGAELDTFRRAAVAVGQNEAYSRYLLLIYVFLTEIPFTRAELKEFRILPTPDASDFALDMLPGLALYGQIPRCYETLKSRKIPEDMIHKMLSEPERAVAAFRKMHNGAEGFHLFKWCQRHIRGDIFTFDCLQAELHYPFPDHACVFRNTQNQWIALAQNCTLHPSGHMLGCRGYEESEYAWSAAITETDTHWEGYAFDAKGLVSNQKVRLEKACWTPVIGPGDPCISLHIPSKVRMDDASVTESLLKIKEFLKLYFPDYPYKAIYASSWILNPDLIDMLGPDANISRFCRRFLPMTQVAAGNDVFHFVFGQQDPDLPLTALPENTSLQRKLKKYYTDGNILHELCGCLIMDGPTD